jgi:hypothetical protein
MKCNAEKQKVSHQDIKQVRLTKVVCKGAYDLQLWQLWVSFGHDGPAAAIQPTAGIYQVSPHTGPERSLSCA